MPPLVPALTLSVAALVVAAAPDGRVLRCRLGRGASLTVCVTTLDGAGQVASRGSGYAPARTAGYAATRPGGYVSWRPGGFQPTQTGAAYAPKRYDYGGLYGKNFYQNKYGVSPSPATVHTPRRYDYGGLYGPNFYRNKYGISQNPASVYTSHRYDNGGLYGPEYFQNKYGSPRPQSGAVPAVFNRPSATPAFVYARGYGYQARPAGGSAGAVASVLNAVNSYSNSRAPYRPQFSYINRPFLPSPRVTVPQRPQVVPLRPQATPARPSVISYPPQVLPVRPQTTLARPSVVSYPPQVLPVRPQTTLARPSVVSYPPQVLPVRPQTTLARPSVVSYPPQVLPVRPQTTLARPSVVSYPPQVLPVRPQTTLARPSVVSYRPQALPARPQTTPGRPSVISYTPQVRPQVRPVQPQSQLPRTPYRPPVVPLPAGRPIYIGVPNSAPLPHPDIRRFYTAASMLGRGRLSLDNSNNVQMICDFSRAGVNPSTYVLTDVVWQKVGRPIYINSPMSSATAFPNLLKCPRTYVASPATNYSFTISGPKTTLVIKNPSSADHGVYRCYATSVSRVDPLRRVPVYMEVQYYPSVSRATPRPAATG